MSSMSSLGRAARRLGIAALLPLLASTSGVALAALPVQRAEVVKRYPHDRKAFTQGLFWRDGRLFESTGLEGRSSLREVRLEDGKPLRRRNLAANVFAEGIVDWGKRLISLEYQTGRGTVWRLRDFAPLRRFRYRGEGWGLTRSATAIIMSDGTARLRLLDPETLVQRGAIEVRAEGRPLTMLNELEWIDGEIWANVWQTEVIARIDPASGRVTGWVDLRGLLPDADRIAGETDVLNGIAWDRKGRRLFVTGKNWPWLYQIKLRPRPRG